MNLIKRNFSIFQNICFEFYQIKFYLNFSPIVQYLRKNRLSYFGFQCLWYLSSVLCSCKKNQVEYYIIFDIQYSISDIQTSNFVIYQIAKDRSFCHRNHSKQQDFNVFFQLILGATNQFKLECDVEDGAFPKPVIQWYKNAEIISKDTIQDIVITDKNEIEFVGMSTVCLTYSSRVFTIIFFTKIAFLFFKWLQYGFFAKIFSFLIQQG